MKRLTPNFKLFNRLSRRKRGMMSNPLFIIPYFFCIFPMNFAMATLFLKEMGKFLREGRENHTPYTGGKTVGKSDIIK